MEITHEQNTPIHLDPLPFAHLLEKLQFHSKETFSEDEAAQYLHCSVNALKRYSLRTRQIKYCLVGRNRVYRKADLEAFLLSVRR